MKKFAIIIYFLAMIFLMILGSFVGSFLYEINSLKKVELPILEGMETKEVLASSIKGDSNGEPEFIVKSENGKIVVYKITNFNNKINQELYKVTNIAVKYLTKSDQLDLESGIKVYGEKKLSSVLEDYV